MSAQATEHYPAQYHDMVSRGFRWLELRAVEAKETLLWQHSESNEYRVTVRYDDGRLVEFAPVGDGTLKITKSEITEEGRERFRDMADNSYTESNYG